MSEWISINEKKPEDGHYVIIGYHFGVGIAQWAGDEWDTVGSNHKHYIFTDKQKVFSSCQAEYWMPLPDMPKETE